MQRKNDWPFRMAGSGWPSLAKPLFFSHGKNKRNKMPVQSFVDITRKAGEKMKNGVILLCVSIGLTMSACTPRNGKMKTTAPKETASKETKVDSAATASATAPTPATILTRDQVAEKHKWNLGEIFADDAAFDTAYKKIESMIPSFKALQGTLDDSAPALLTALKQRDQILAETDRINCFAGMSYHQDMSESHASGRNDRAQTLLVKVGEATSWFTPEILSIPWEKLDGWLKSNSELGVYRHALEDIQRQKAHVLSPREEELLAMAGEVAAVPSNVYGRFTNTDLDFPKIRGEKGEEVQLSPAVYTQFLYCPDRRVRRDAFLGLHGVYAAKKNTLASLLSSQVKQHMFYAKARHYNSSLESALDGPNVPVNVYKNLVDTVDKNVERLHHYVAMRKKLMKLDDIHGYDLYVPMVDAPQDKIAYENAVETILTALAPLGADYTSTLRGGFEGRWIDVFETKNKRSGAYCWGSYLTHPYLLLNYQGTMNDRSTVAHEMGHAMHSWYTHKGQPMAYGDYATFCAEVASTVNEVILAHYLLNNAKTDTERLLILQQQIEGIRTTVFRQAMFAEFELQIHEMVESGKPLTADSAMSTYRDLVAKYYGPELVIEPEAAAEGLRIPHFYSNFYVFNYATSHCAATNIGRRIIDKEPNAVGGLMNFLSAGSSKYPLDVLKLAGVDMTTPKPIEDTMKLFSELMDQFEALYNKQQARPMANAMAH